VVAGLVLVGLLGAPAQLAVRQAGAHNWWSYPDPVGDVPADYPGAAAVIAAQQRPGDGIVYQVSDENHWMPDTGVQYYLRLHGQPEPRDVFQAKTPAQAGGFQPVECTGPAQCLHGRPRLWVVYVDNLPGGPYLNPFAAIEPAQASVLRADGYRIQRVYSEDGITVALLVAR
jgi:mannosyltransferase